MGLTVRDLLFYCSTDFCDIAIYGLESDEILAEYEWVENAQDGEYADEEICSFEVENNVFVINIDK